jgi:hypothetical protein
MRGIVVRAVLAVLCLTVAFDASFIKVYCFLFAQWLLLSLWVEARAALRGGE